MNRQDLIDYRNNKKWVKNRLTELEERKKIIGRLTAIYGDSGGNGSSEIYDKIAEDLATLMDQTNEYVEELLKLDKKTNTIISILDKMENTRYRNILWDKYIAGKELEDIANDPDVNLDYKYVCNLHGYALNEFDKICEKFFSKVEK